MHAHNYNSVALKRYMSASLHSHHGTTNLRQYAWPHFTRKDVAGGEGIDGACTGRTESQQQRLVNDRPAKFHFKKRNLPN
jgi:hypothetical protein